MINFSKQTETLKVFYLLAQDKAEGNSNWLGFLNSVSFSYIETRIGGSYVTTYDILGAMGFPYAILKGSSGMHINRSDAIILINHLVEGADFQAISDVLGFTTSPYDFLKDIGFDGNEINIKNEMPEMRD
jgi:hypothetical protein